MVHSQMELNQLEYNASRNTECRKELSTVFLRHPWKLFAVNKIFILKRKPVCVKLYVFPECSSFTYKVWRCALFCLQVRDWGIGNFTQQLVAYIRSHGSGLLKSLNQKTPGGFLCDPWSMRFPKGSFYLSILSLLLHYTYFAGTDVIVLWSYILIKCG